MKSKIYIAGPMRGLPQCNLPAFYMAQKRWESGGWLVFSPGAIVKALGYPENEVQVADREHLNHVFQIDFACLFAADAIGLLPGWENSMGATAELALAQVLSLQVFDAVTMQPLNIPAKPWIRLRMEVNPHPVIHMTREQMEKEIKKLKGNYMALPNHLKITSPMDGVPGKFCSYCKKLFEDKCQGTQTLDEFGEVTLCEQCYRETV